jgi:folate-binding protein YgfZ
VKSEWKTFLAAMRAEFSEDTSKLKVQSYGNPEQERQIAHSGNIICDLSHYGLIRADGDDAEAFLQGQFTNDLQQVDSSHSQLSSYCNPKGRMLSNFRIFQRDKTLYLSLPGEMLDDTLNRLNMYVMRSKVSLQDASDSLMRIGLSGNRVEEFLSTITGSIPVDTDVVSQQDDYTIVRISGIEPRFEIYGSLDGMKKMWQTLNLNSSPIGADAWELLNIQAGLPVIIAETSESFIPQMTNMELINGVSFKKGCYTGQEIVARMHYLGKLKKRMYRIRIDTDKKPLPGDSLFAKDSKGGSNTGTIVSAQLNHENKYEALAVIQITDAENQTLRLYDADGPEIEILKLPYSLNPKEKE